MSPGTAKGARGMSIDNTSHKIVPFRGISHFGYPPWVTTTAYAQGDYVVGGDNDDILYMAIGAGTSGATKPVHTSGEVSDGAVTWLRVPFLARKGVTVINESDVSVYCAVDQTAEIGKGVELNAYGGSHDFFDPQNQDEIHAIAASGSGKNVTIQEF